MATGQEAQDCVSAALDELKTLVASAKRIDKPFGLARRILRAKLAGHLRSREVKPRLVPIEKVPEPADKRGDLLGLEGHEIRANLSSLERELRPRVGLLQQLVLDLMLQNLTTDEIAARLRRPRYNIERAEKRILERAHFLRKT